MQAFCVFDGGAVAQPPINARIKKVNAQFLVITNPSFFRQPEEASSYCLAGNHPCLPGPEKQASRSHGQPLLGGDHAALGPSLVKSGRADAALPAQIRHRYPSLSLPQSRQNLTVREPRSLLAELPVGEKIHLLRPLVGSGDYQQHIIPTAYSLRQRAITAYRSLTTSRSTLPRLLNNPASGSPSTAKIAAFSAGGRGGD